jgi:hypothetical protein
MTARFILRLEALRVGLVLMGILRMGVLLAGVALAGCKLVDQTTFAPSPEARPAAAAVAPQTDPRVALLTIGYDTPNPNYQDVLRYAVREAEMRAPGVQYDVIAMLPTGSDVAQAQGSAAEVMRAIMAQGVAANRVQLGLRTEPAGRKREVRVYVR